MVEILAPYLEGLQVRDPVLVAFDPAEVRILEPSE